MIPFGDIHRKAWEFNGDDVTKTEHFCCVVVDNKLLIGIRHYLEEPASRQTIKIHSRS